MEIHPQSGFKSILVFPSLEVPDFLLVTGENGAGKTQLLEAIHSQAFLGSWGGTQQDIRYLTSEQLGSPLEFTGGKESREEQVARLESTVREFDKVRSHSPYDTDEGARNGLRDVLRSVGITDAGFSLLESRSPKPLADWTHQDFAEHTPIEFGMLDPFSVQVGDLFSRYMQLLTANNYNRFLASEGQMVDFREPLAFEREFGSPPWALMNTALERVGLRYRFQAPSPSMLPMTEPAALLDPVTGTRLTVSMLSTGERALLSVAMSAYSVSNRRDLTPMPRIVLLDEPDAALHPSMIRSLISLLVENFVSELGIKVIMTTHSPTTVALAPDESIWVMYKDKDPRLQPAASKDSALSHLLVGVPTVSVSAENRRVVVVESRHDEARYTSIETLVHDDLDSERSLIFMAAGGTNFADGSASVIEFVQRLRENGNVSVWGLIDRDERTSVPNEHVRINFERYTIENLILDPVSVGLLLLADAQGDAVTSLDPISYVSFDFAVDSQTVSDYVVSRIATTEDDLSTRSVEYCGGTTVSVPAFWLDAKGHELADRVRAAFPELNSYRESNKILDAIIKRVWSNRRTVIPASIPALFKELLA